jgi:hypothetical protein
MDWAVAAVLIALITLIGVLTVSYVASRAGH